MYNNKSDTLVWRIDMGQLTIVSEDEKKQWNMIVKSFCNWDIYYLFEYSKSFSLYGEGDPYLIHYEGKNMRLCYAVLKNDIAEIDSFNGRLTKGVYFDLCTPYGYGGPLVEGDFSKEEQLEFEEQFLLYCRTNGIVAQFARFHPLLQNHKQINYIGEKVYVKDAIKIDTLDTEQILHNMKKECKNRIRKAKKNGVTIQFDQGERVAEFIQIYESTMNRLHASDFYFFEPGYYQYLLDHMKDNLIIFYAMMEERVVSAAIFFYNHTFMHYHLAGTLKEYLKYAPMNLLLYEAAYWAYNRGIKELHLGGGVNKEDSLFTFKKSFNKEGNVEIWDGRVIVDRRKYEVLLQKRKELDVSFDINNTYYLQYRKQ